MIQKGREEIQVEWEKARLELKREVADLVFLATGKVLGSVIDRDRHMSLVNKVVEGVGEGHVRN
jgi:F0F1-type ATP synthase membrane subunit b/b'